MIIGASSGSYGTALRSSYVVFGRASGFAAAFNLSSLDGNNGFRLFGPKAYDYSGRSVSAAGDVNGDGFDDVIIGAPDTSSPSFFQDLAMWCSAGHQVLPPRSILVALMAATALESMAQQLAMPADMRYQTRAMLMAMALMMSSLGPVTPIYRPSKHREDDLAGWSRGVDGKRQHLETCTTLFDFMDNVEDIRVSRPKRSKRTTVSTSLGLRNSWTVASSVLLSRLAPLTFSARMMPQPAAFNAAVWTSRSSLWC
jgi:hypothetical protein